jgi:hypothetical protein
VGEDLRRPDIREDAEINRRNFRITKRILDKYDYTPGCVGCEATLNDNQFGQRDHTVECRNRIESEMKNDPMDKQWIDDRNIRIKQEEPQPREQGIKREEEPKEEVREQPRSSSVETVEQDRQGSDVPVPESDDVMDDEVLYGEFQQGEQPARLSAQRETREDTNPQPAKKIRLEAIKKRIGGFVSELKLEKYDGSRQKLANVILDFELNRKSNKGCEQDITDIIQKISERETMTPHNDNHLEDVPRHDVLRRGQWRQEAQQEDGHRCQKIGDGVLRKDGRLQEGPEDRDQEAWRQDDHDPMD